MTNLAGRAATGYSCLIVTMAALLFLPAWTIAYWQAWAYLGVFSACTTFITLYLWRHDRGLLERRVVAGPQAEPQSEQQRLQGLASLAFVGIFLVASVDHRRSWSSVPAPLSIIADVLVVLGLLVVYLVFRENTFAAGTIDVMPGQRVVSSGPYAIVRHPMYAGALVFLIATPIALGSAWALIAVVALIAILAARAVAEERYLAYRLPGYSDYLEKVRWRFVPFLW